MFTKSPICGWNWKQCTTVGEKCDFFDDDDTDTGCDGEDDNVNDNNNDDDNHDDNHVEDDDDDCLQEAWK